MPWIPEHHMADVHVIRQDYARAKQAFEADPNGDPAGLLEQDARRGRAVRSLHRDDNATVAHLSAMFRCSKTAIRTYLAQEETND